MLCSPGRVIRVQAQEGITWVVFLMPLSTSCTKGTGGLNAGANPETDQDPLQTEVAMFLA